MATRCKITYSEICVKCSDKVCNKQPIIKHILGSSEPRRASNLIKVLDKFNMQVEKYTHL